MHSGQTRAVLTRKARAGVNTDILLREKRMGDLAWQMNVTAIKLTRFGANNPAANALNCLHAEAKVEYDRLKREIEVENAPEEFGVYLG